MILEALVKRADAPPLAFVLYARLLASAGEVEEAVRQYHRGVSADPAVADKEFAERFGNQLRRRRRSRLRRRNERSRRGARPLGVVRARCTGQRSRSTDRASRSPTSAGWKSVKEEIRIKIIHPMNHPELYRAYGKTIGGGILLYGPPGCGKTYLARATAGEIHAGFLAVGINDVLEMWIGNSERNLHALFEQARQNTPCVLFFDEVDAPGGQPGRPARQRRAPAHQPVPRRARRHRQPQRRSLDPGRHQCTVASRRRPFADPGRFDRILFVPPPDLPARASILRLLCQGKPVQNIDHEHLAKKTDLFSGADLKAVVDLAIEAKLREAMKAGVPRPLTTKDLLTAAAAVKPSTREWFATARNYALYSNQGGIYDDILKHLKLG